MAARAALRHQTKKSSPRSFDGLQLLVVAAIRLNSIATINTRRSPQRDRRIAIGTSHTMKVSPEEPADDFRRIAGVGVDDPRASDIASLCLGPGGPRDTNPGAPRSCRVGVRDRAGWGPALISGMPVRGEPPSDRPQYEHRYDHGAQGTGRLLLRGPDCRPENTTKDEDGCRAGFWGQRRYAWSFANYYATGRRQAHRQKTIHSNYLEGDSQRRTSLYGFSEVRRVARHIVASPRAFRPLRLPPIRVYLN